MATRKNVPQVFMFFGRVRTLKEIAEFQGLRYGTLYARFKAGYTIATGQALRPPNNLHRVVVRAFGPKAQPIPGQRKDD